MSGEERLVGSCRIESPTLFFPSHLHSRSPSFFFFYLSHSCLPFSPLPCEIILIWIHILHATRHTHTHTHTHTVNTARHSAELWFHCSVYSYCFHLLRRWLSNELENTKQSHEEVLRHKQLPAVSVRSETLYTHSSCTNTQMRGYADTRPDALKDDDTMPNSINKWAPWEEENKRRRKKLVLPDAGDLLRPDWMAVLGEPRVREPDIFP